MAETIIEMMVCEEHMEMALDDFVDLHELAPDVSLLVEPHTCDCCALPAKYRLVGHK
jgi:CxxH/CxxC protein (TIGR04129 family)